MKRHEPDFFSLAAGLVFTVLGIVFAISAATGWAIDGRWIAPTVLVFLGGGGVAAALAASRREQAAEAATPAESEQLAGS